MQKFISIADFNQKGGWVTDSQFIEIMGTPYLLAHGLGTPVADAVGAVELDEAGTYHVYAYTYNWNAPWKPEFTPGIFEVTVGGYKKVFGDQGEAWGWQDGGEFSFEKGTQTLILHDLTGYEGRLGALLITNEEPKAIREYFPAPAEVTASYDYIVVGGGITGITAAVSAARSGLKTALVQDRPVLGGNNSSEVRVWLSGKYCFDRFPKLGNITAELEQKVRDIFGMANQASNYEDEKKLGLVTREENITLYLSHSVVEAEMEGDQIQSIVALDVEKCVCIRLQAPLYADCSGDGVLAAYAGADYEVTTSGHMELSNFWCVENTGVEQTFAPCPWAIDLTEPDFPGRLRAKGNNPEGEKEWERKLGCWSWGAGFEHHPILKAEYARDTNFRAMYGAWDAIKNVDGDYKNYRIAYSSFIAGKRESRRFLGPVILTTRDMLHKTVFDDAIIGIDWHLDVHTPNRKYYRAFVEGDAFYCSDGPTRWEVPYYMPYRCMYSRNISNLFFAGRNVSATHDGLGPVRVMRTCGMMGEAIGKAAWLCKEYGLTPDGVYQQKLEELLDCFR